jgi:hypothetical protein
MSSVQTQYARPYPLTDATSIRTARPETMRTAPNYVTATLLPTLVRVGYPTQPPFKPAHIRERHISTASTRFLWGKSSRILTLVELEKQSHTRRGASYYWVRFAVALSPPGPNGIHQTGRRISAACPYSCLSHGREDSPLRWGSRFSVSGASARPHTLWTIRSHSS